MADEGPPSPTGRAPAPEALSAGPARGLLAALALLLALVLSRESLAALPVPDYLVQGSFALILIVASFGGGGIFALSSGKPA